MSETEEGRSRESRRNAIGLLVSALILVLIAILYHSARVNTKRIEELEKNVKTTKLKLGIEEVKKGRDSSLRSE